MTTSAQVRTAWSDNIWDHTTIQALTTKIYDYDITTESTKEFTKLREDQQINCFTYVVSRAERILILNQTEHTFTVRIRYYRQADIPGVNFNDLITAFETISGLVVSELTSSWDGTVDFYRVQPEPPQISLIQMEGQPVWVGDFRYFGFKYT